MAWFQLQKIIQVASGLILSLLAKYSKKFLVAYLHVHYLYKYVVAYNVNLPDLIQKYRLYKLMPKYPNMKSNIFQKVQIQSKSNINPPPSCTAPILFLCMNIVNCIGHVVKDLARTGLARRRADRRSKANPRPPPVLPCWV